MQVVKRNGELEDFNIEKVYKAVAGAFHECGKALPEDVKMALKRELDKSILRWSVEAIQDTIEMVLGRLGYHDELRAFIKYRDRKAEERRQKKELLKRDWLTPAEKKNFSVNAIRLLAVRYLWKNEKGEFVETVDDLFKRVAVMAALPEISLFHKKPVSLVDSENISDIFEDVWQALVKAELINDDEYKAFIFNIRGEEYFFTKWHIERLVSLINRFYRPKETLAYVERIAYIMHDIKHEKEKLFTAYVEAFYREMINQRMMPNTPALVNAGRPLGMCSACFVVDSEDSVEGIFDTAKEIALITKAGGGIGLNLSVFRPSGDIVRGTMGVASGAISWLHLYNSVLDVLKQGSTRRGAGMAVMWYWHPEIMQFIEAKKDNDGFSVIPNFNISVGTDNEFWEAVKNDDYISLINPRNNEEVGRIKARNMLRAISEMAWKVADPAVLNFGISNDLMPISLIDKIKATNPCGEQMLLPYQSCNLISINVEKFINNGQMDWEAYKRTIHLAYRFADNINDVNKFPLDKISETTRKGRNIGLGLMGIANALFKLGYSYEEENGIKFMENIAKELTLTAYEKSVQTAIEKYPAEWSWAVQKKVEELGTLPLWATVHDNVDEQTQKRIEMIVQQIKQFGIRNIDVTTMPPTGSVSMIADTSNGVEPVFGLVFKKEVTVGTFYYANPHFQNFVERAVINSEDVDVIMSRVSDNAGSLKGLEKHIKPLLKDKKLWEEMQRVYRTAMDLHHWSHLVGMAAIAKWTSNAVSKTINMASTVSVDDVFEAFTLSSILGLKGVTIYRDGSLSSQVMVAGESAFTPHPPSDYVKNIIKHAAQKNGFNWLFDKPVDKDKLPINIGFAITHEDEEVLTHCPECGTKLIRQAGCLTCPNCGWSACTVS
jgi:ribonucleoside-diphosphate reductase alpha chain